TIPTHCQLYNVAPSQTTEIAIAVNGSILDKILVSTGDMYFRLVKNKIYAKDPKMPVAIMMTTFNGSISNSHCSGLQSCPVTENIIPPMIIPQPIMMMTPTSAISRAGYSV